MKKSLYLCALLSLFAFGCTDDSANQSAGDKAVCGDEAIGGDEVCDDGNTADGDGCSKDCLTVEDGWKCPNTGGQCTPKPVCGDKKVGDGEACDDGNTKGGDGCSADCKTVEDGWNCPKSGGQCTEKSGCGNGIVADGEACDDGNTNNGDGCTADCKAVEDGWICPKEGGACKKEPACGDGNLDDGEACDDGNTKGDDGCSADCKTIDEAYQCDKPGYDCKKITCGDAELDEGEDCDEGEDNADYGMGFCSTSCHPAHYCGDKRLDKVDTENGEECDEGEDTSSQYNGCSVDCKRVNYCGDGVIQPSNEQCDDGDTTDGDGCSSTCKLEANFTCVTKEGKSYCSPILCGNGVLDENEECDDGNRDADVVDGCSMICLVDKGWQCPTGESGKSECVKTCGNGTLEESAGEKCDDGNTADGDGCSSLCVIEPGYMCNGTKCFARACGDGIIAGSEACDDGNTTDGDGCSKFCLREPGWHCDKAGEKCAKDVCGDGIVSGDETCDEGHTEHPEYKTDGCVDCRVQMGWKCETPGASCTAAVCGNGILEGAETCEEENAECCVGCKIQPFCLCDTDGKNCTKGYCGNGILEAGEECDDGKKEAGDGCSPECTVEAIFSCADGKCKATCGDGLTLWEAGEECDDGNLTNGDGCSSDCKVESGYSCTKFDGPAPSVLNLPITYRDFRAYTYQGVNNYATYTPVTGTGRGFFTKDEIDNLAPECFSNTVYRKRNFPGVGTPIPDFQGNGCYSWNRCANVIYPELNEYGRPVLRPSSEMTKHADANSNFDNAESCAQLYTCPEVFDYWYKDSRMSVTVKTTLPLSSIGNGRYQYKNGSFWPLANLGFNDPNAASLYDVRDTKSGLFTSEFQSYFKYNGDEELTFEGDDDVWVFFNGHLALEFAGIHGTWGQTIKLTKERAAQFHMYSNGIYSLQMFHAERCQGGSGYTLTLSGFINMGTSTCETKCGDGIVRGNEECDFEGDHSDVNLQKKYGCSADCKKQPSCGNDILEAGEQCDVKEDWCVGCINSYCGNGQFDEDFEQCDLSAPESDKNHHTGCQSTCRFAGCGDGIIQDKEECDDSNLNDDDMCTSKCTLPYCGDGIVSPAIGEVCDDGVNDGSYGGCGFGCTYPAPKCGDGIVDKLSGEECDDGNGNKGGYGGCLNCKLDIRCGDGILQQEYEQCDPGIDSSCTTSCTFPIY